MPKWHMRTQRVVYINNNINFKVSYAKLLTVNFFFLGGGGVGKGREGWPTSLLHLNLQNLKWSYFTTL